MVHNGHRMVAFYGDADDVISECDKAVFVTNVKNSKSGETYIVHYGNTWRLIKEAHDLTRNALPTILLVHGDTFITLIAVEGANDPKKIEKAVIRWLESSRGKKVIEKRLEHEVRSFPIGNYMKFKCLQNLHEGYGRHVLGVRHATKHGATPKTIVKAVMDIFVWKIHRKIWPYAHTAVHGLLRSFIYFPIGNTIHLNIHFTNYP
jgi:hypothetical protein